MKILKRDEGQETFHFYSIFSWLFVYHFPSFLHEYDNTSGRLPQNYLAVSNRIRIVFYRCFSLESVGMVRDECGFVCPCYGSFHVALGV